MPSVALIVAGSTVGWRIRRETVNSYSLMGVSVGETGGKSKTDSLATATRPCHVALVCAAPCLTNWTVSPLKQGRQAAPGYRSGSRERR